jgi:hypothetical protein
MALTAHAVVKHEPATDQTPGGWGVTTGWTVDTPDTLDRADGIGFEFGPKHRELATRLAAAITAGVVFTAPEIKRDVNGRTYVSASCQVLGRHANADLKRLGF